jgi:hypothetical protein
MADAIGTIANVLSIIEAVKSGARLVNEWKRIPEEIQSLQV